MTATRIDTCIDTRIVWWFPFFIISSIWTVSRNEKIEIWIHHTVYPQRPYSPHHWLYLKNSKTPKEQYLQTNKPITHTHILHTFDNIAVTRVSIGIAV